jgi:hypothetical protein
MLLILQGEWKMRLLVILAGLLAFAAAPQAAVVTFDDMPVTEAPDCGTGGLCPHSISTPQGFIFSLTTYDPMYQSISVTDGGPTGNYTWAGAAYDAEVDIEITHQTGAAFDLHSLDTLLYNVDESVDFHSISDLNIFGYDSNGNEIASLFVAPPRDDSPSAWTNLSFDDNWNSVHRVVLNSQRNSSQWGTFYHYPKIDNFAATAVPIPAAAWLFGSALAGLGWMRRKQSV